MEELTEVLQATEENLLLAARLLREGELVAFPTETVYGLGANGLMAEASKKIYAAKGRPSDNPLILHIASMEDLPPLVSEIPKEAKVLAEKFWPGPLTMVLPKSSLVPYETTGGLETVAVRCPSHEVARRLLLLARVPVAAPSANVSGRPSPTKAEHVFRDMKGRIPLIIDGGEVGIGLESTIVDLTGDQPLILRPGAVTREMMEEALQTEVPYDRAVYAPLEEGIRPKAPGMKYRHYAPKADFLLLTGEEEEKKEAFRLLLKENTVKKRAFLLSASMMRALSLGEEKGRSHSLGESTEEMAHCLFSRLREMDDEGAEEIISECFPEEGFGVALMNRMKKAAGGKLRSARDIIEEWSDRHDSNRM